MTKLLKQTQRNKSISVPTRLINTPLLVSEDHAAMMLNALNMASIPNMEALFIDDDIETSTEGYVAIIPVIGGLQYRGYGWYWRMSYTDIRKWFREAMADEAVKAIVFDIDSPGGEVNGLFDLVDEIHEARGDKPIYAVANEDAYSAAYAIASAADKVYLSRTAAVGSVGVIAIHFDQSGFDESIGVKYTAVYAGSHKNDYTTHEPLKDSVRDALQASVNKTQDLFVETIARNRGMTAEAVRKTEAAIYEGAEAVDIGFADAVMPWDQAMEHIISNISNGGTTMNLADLKTGITTLMTDQKDGLVSMLKDLGFVSAADQPEPVDEEKLKAEATEAGKKEGLEKGSKEATDRACEIIGVCQLAEVPDMAAGLIKTDASIEDVKTKVLEEKARRSGGDEIHSTVGALSTGGVNPLIQDAQQRADARKN